MNKDFLDNTIDSFLQCVKSKKLVLFGAGAEMNRALPLFIEKNGLIPKYLLDNDFRKWYSHLYGYKIYEPEILRDEDKNNLVVLITSIYPFRIKEQIERLGVIHYYSSLLFVEPMMGKHQFMVTF